MAHRKDNGLVREMANWLQIFGYESIARRKTSGTKNV